MRFTLFLLLLTVFSCKRNHTSVLVKVTDKDTGNPIENIKIKVYRKGKENLFIKKNSLVVGEGKTNIWGEDLLSFKYDRGNEYTVEVFDNMEYWGNVIYLWTDLKKGKNLATFELNQVAYLKLNLKSLDPKQKYLSVEIEGISNSGILYTSFYNHLSPLDSIVFKGVAINNGEKNLIWKVDSAGYKISYSSSIQLKGHDTTYATINF